MKGWILVNGNIRLDVDFVYQFADRMTSSHHVDPEVRNWRKVLLVTAAWQTNEFEEGHVKEAPVPLSVYRPNAPAYLVELIMRCLAKLPADRPQLAESIVNALDEGIRTTPEATIALDIALTQSLNLAEPPVSADGTATLPMPLSPTGASSSVAPSSIAPSSTAPSTTTPSVVPPRTSAIAMMLGFVAVAVLAAVVLIQH